MNIRFELHQQWADSFWPLCLHLNLQKKKNNNHASLCSHENNFTFFTAIWIQPPSTSEASIWPAGVQRIERRHGCAGEVWQHCFTLAGVINSEAIKTRWRAAEVTLTLSQPRRAQLRQATDLSIAVNLLSCVILRHKQSYTWITI